MSRAGKHHYIPVFYLKQWAGEDKCICEFSKPYDRVKPRRTNPDGTGYVHGLNRVEGLPPAEEQYLEDVFFKIADDDAARALPALLQDRQWNFSQRERSGWSRFIISLLLRNPESMQKQKIIAAALFKDALPRIEAEYAKDRKPGDPETYAEHAKRHGPNPAARMIIRSLQKNIDNVRVGQYINDMRWMVLRDLEPEFELLTSDRPVVIANGMREPTGLIMLPISPNHLFVATNNQQTEQQIQTLWHERKMVRDVNHLVVCQSRKLVFGIDDRQLNFVSTRLGLRHISDPLENYNYDAAKMDWPKV